MLGAAAGLAAARCGGSAPARPARPVRMPLPAEPLTLDFPHANDNGALSVAQLVSAGLVALDQRLEPVPQLAESWSWSDDHLALTFRLREGVLWHDGRPLTAADVVHTWRQVVDPATARPDRAQDFQLVSAVEAPSPGTVVVRYRRPFAPALLSWSSPAMPIVPAHRVFDAPGPFVGCGPFRLARWDRGQRLVLEANDRFARGAPGVARLELEVLRDTSTRYAALRAGRVDLCVLFPEQLALFRRDEELLARCTLARYRALFLQYVAWRMDGSNPFFADRRVRRAMTLAIDRPSFVRDLFRGAGTVAVTSFHPDLWGHDPALAPWPFDPRAAAALLDEAGWRAGADGVRTKGGRRFEFGLLFPNTTAETGHIAAFIADHLRRVGVVARLEPAEWAVFQERAGKRRYEAVLGFRNLGSDPDPYDLWHSSQAGGGVNYAGFADPAVDALIERGREVFARDEREAIYRDIERRLHEEQPDTFLMHPESWVAVDRGLAGVEPGPRGLLMSWPGPFGWHWTGAAGAGR